jgi:hypothetical protein
MAAGLSGVAAIAVMASLVTPASATSTTLSAVADAYVLSSKPNVNEGSSTTLRIRNLIKISYLRFQVPAIPAGESVSTATLRVYATTGDKCNLGVEVLRAASDTWGESTIKWKNQPGPTGPVLSSDTWSGTGYKTFSVTPVVTGAGPVSFVLRHAQACGANADATFRSREAANGPELVVETSAGGAPACSDTRDNDADGLIDHPADPGCATSSDTDETNPPPSSGVKVGVAGDIVCSPSHSDFDGSNPAKCQHRGTADLLVGMDAILPVGDIQYPDGALSDFNQAYDPSWGLFAPTTYPVPGNHEYHTAGADGYFDYWAAKGRPTGGRLGYYSFDLGSWHIVALNSSDSCPSCAEGTPQNNFLEQDLAGTTKPCILAYWHHPLFNSGTGHGSTLNVRPFWDDLYAVRADIVINGHEHNYQRSAKQTPAGQAIANGIREFVVGTGGKGLYALQTTPDPNLDFAQDDSFGTLRLTLGNGSYSWQFVSIDGTVLDSGGPVACN